MAGQVFTSDHALKLEWIPNWIAIIGSGYIGLEFSDVYTALGSEVTFIEVKPRSLVSFHKAGPSLILRSSPPVMLYVFSKSFFRMCFLL